MARYGVETKLSPDETIAAAKAYFGTGGLGLESTDENPCCVNFEGGGGHVSVTVGEAGKKTSVELATREWDYHIKQFMRKIA